MRRFPDAFRNLMEESIRYSQGILNERAMALLEATIDGRRPHTPSLWRMMTFGRWMHRFGVSAGSC